MKFIWDLDGFNLTNFIFNSLIIVLLFAFVFFVLFRVVKRKLPIICLSVVTALLVFSYLANLNQAFVVCILVICVGLFLVLFTNIGDFRRFVANPFIKRVAKSGKFGIEKIYDKQDLYKRVNDAVLYMSKNKIGGLITFEKNSSLNDLIVNGVRVNAPVTSELLLTIFYPGTRLHDGAVIIHNNEIVAASVFFTPSTKAFAGKYGSRHRAAIGISEVSDAVTVVVSEETGRISFAIDGNLLHVNKEDFIKVLETYLSDNSNQND